MIEQREAEVGIDDHLMKSVTVQIGRADDGGSQGVGGPEGPVSLAGAEADAVDVAAAPVVSPIAAELRRSRVGGGVRVIAVPIRGPIPVYVPLGDPLRGSVARLLNEGIGGGETITVVVPVEGLRRHTFVNLAIAVVVQLVAGLAGTGEDSRVEVLAVPGQGDEPRWSRAGLYQRGDLVRSSGLEARHQPIHHGRACSLRW